MICKLALLIVTIQPKIQRRQGRFEMIHAVLIRYYAPSSLVEKIYRNLMGESIKAYICILGFFAIYLT